MATIDRETLFGILTELGNRLTQRTTLCIVGSTAAILLGHAGRQTPDIDVWDPASDYDVGELRRACLACGLLFDPLDELDPGAIYVRLLRAGAATLPAKLKVESLGRFGNLTLVTPLAELIVATTLNHDDERDVTARRLGGGRVNRTALELRLQTREALVSGSIVRVFRMRDWELLERIAAMVDADAPLDLAATDPAEFATLRAGITRFHIKGWSGMTAARVRATAASERARLALKQD